MRREPSPLIGLALAVLALVGAAAALAVANRRAPSGQPDLDLELIERDVARLEALQSALRSELDDFAEAASQAPVTTPLAAGEAAPEDVVLALAQLETRVDELEEEFALGIYGPVADDWNRREAQALELPRSSLARDGLEAYRVQLSDAANRDDERLGALRMLQLFPDEMVEGDWLVAAAIDLIRTAQDPEVVENAVEAVARERDPRYLAALVEVLEGSASEGARCEAADALRDYVGDPRVELALRTASDTDPSADVRKHARRALGN
ncbi:hypothetical protein Pla86_49070 [Planctomycetes bacterium Pla86]|uniref:HEAT repeat protein n=2 Tax=Engelhardtia mirabilis TaxID=2528011 RepID=A0A518BS36_9BACT|nr:hypothetical protein Pla133_49090 [Planctomycetes bacterium Pla133]QDV04113.1 hypothetical protein Pla86_49070 [Planctomycetes bacterium Pla86]